MGYLITSYWLQTTLYTRVLFDVSFPKGMSQCLCPFTGCPGFLQTRNGLQNYFVRQYLGDSLRILEDHPTPFPRCERCGRQVPLWRLRNRHYESDKFQIGEKYRIRGATLKHCSEARQVEIRLNTDHLEPVAAFPYLVCTVSYNNINWAALYQNLCKA